MAHLSYKGGCDIRVLRRLKEELCWAIDKRLHSYTTKNLKNKAVFNLQQYRMCCYVILSNVFQLTRIKI